MRKFRALVAVNLRALLSGTNGGAGGSRKRKVTGLGTLVILAGVCLYLSCVYSFSFASQLAKVGMVELILMIMPVFVVAIGLLYTVFAVQGVVFGGKDNDLMLSMPISSFTLMLSRVLALYLENLLFALFIMLPAGIAYGINGGALSAGLVLRLVVATAVLAFFPSAVSLLLGFLLAWASSKMKGGRLGKNLLYLVFFVVIFAGSYRLGYLTSGLAQYAAGLTSTFSGWGTLFIWFQRGVCGSLSDLMLFTLVCVGVFLLLVWLFGLRYKSIVTGLTTTSVRSDYKLGRLSSTGQRRALLKREADRFTSSTIYLFNAGLGILFLLGGSVYAVVKHASLQSLLPQLGEAPVLLLLALCVGFILSMDAVAASSVSLEGNCLWILKEAPVGVKDIFSVKYGFEILLHAPVLLVSTVLLSFAFALSPAEGLLLFLASELFSVAHALFGLLINLTFPKLDAVSDAAVVKQSAAAALGMFAPMLFLLLGAGVYWLLGKVLGTMGVLSVCCALLGVLSLILYRILSTKGQRMFLQLD